MFRIKWICRCLLLAVFLSACGPAGADSREESVQEENSGAAYKDNADADKKYETFVVEKSDFTYTIDISSTRTEFYFPQKEIIRCQYEGAYMKETVAWRRGDEVKKGEVLFVLGIEGRDELAEERLQLEYQRLFQEYKEIVQQYEGEIAVLAQTIGKAQASEQEQLKLQKEKLEAEFRLYQIENGAAVEAAKKNYEDYKEKYNDKAVVAPFDGFISYNYREKEGKTIEYGRELLSIHKNEGALLAIEARAFKDIEKAASEYHLFVPELPVSIVVGKDETIAGKIVGSPVGTEVAEGGNGDMAIYIAAEDQTAVEKILERDSAGVTGIMIQLPGVVTVDSTYAQMKDNLSGNGENTGGTGNFQNTGYVYLLEEGKVMKQQLLLGPIVTREKGIEHAVVLQGLTEGQVVVADVIEAEE